MTAGRSLRWQPERLQRQIDADPSLWLFSDLRSYLVRSRRKEEPILRNAALANTCREMARQGPDLFYRGALTDSMIAAAAGRWPGRSDLTREDFDRYRPVVRDELCRRYRGWSVCGIPAPSSGGSRIIGYVVKTLIGVLDWGLSLQEAIDRPNFLHLGLYLELEEGTAWADRAGVLQAMGYRVRVRPLESGIHGIERLMDETAVPVVRTARWRGGADPRMDGVAYRERCQCPGPVQAPHQ